MSAGSAKSYGLCALIILKCLEYPNINVGLARNELTTLKKTTLTSFFEVCSDLGLEPDTHFKYNSTSGIIRFFNSSKVTLIELTKKPSDPEFTRLGGLLLTFGVIDEVGEVNHKAFTIFKTRLGRWKNKEFNIKPICLMSCNPVKTWVYTEFYQKHKKGILEDYKMFIQALPTDNPHLSQEYIDNLKRGDSSSVERLVYGNWEYNENDTLLSYDKVITFMNNRSIKEDKTYDYYISCDVARLGKDKTIILVWRSDKTLVDYKEMEINTIPECVDEIKKLKTKYNIISNGNIAIDQDGVGGGVVDMLPNCKSIVNNSRPLNNENYQNLKTQLQARLVDYINNEELFCDVNFDYETKELIQQELTVIKRENVYKDAKVQFTSKDKMKDLIGRSPDYLDALSYGMIYFIDDHFVEEVEIDIWF